MQSSARNIRNAFGAWAVGVGRIVDLGSHVARERRSYSIMPDQRLANHWRAVGGYISNSMEKHGLKNGRERD